MTSKTYHFIGIGGIGMSALARILLKKGYRVTGSDVNQSAITDALVKEGALVFIGHNEDHVNEGIVVYSSAIKEKNSEYEKAKRLGLPMLHRADLLHRLALEKLPLLVTGTHGKTTTTALLVSVLMAADCDPSFVVGGTLQGLQINGRKGDGPYFVAEADESDGSFLKTAPFGAIVTNCENDHLDYWKTAEHLNQGFRDFLGSVQKHLFWCKDDLRLCSFAPGGYSYGFSKDADLQILDWKQKNEGIVFDVQFNGKRYSEIFIPLFGRHNVLNGAAVFGLVLSLNVDEESIRKAFGAFGGVGRRLEKKGEAHGVICFDDYGHHPTEIQVTLQALRKFAQDRRVVVLFQPHRFTRTRDLWSGFVDSFRDADIVLITDIYGAGEEPIDGITGEKLAREMNAMFIDSESQVSRLLRPFDVFITMGAGDVTHMGIPILNSYADRAPKLRVGVITGGCSVEHEVSLLSAKNITQNLDPEYFSVHPFVVSKEGCWDGKERISPKILKELSLCDVVIPVMHGPGGEDGMIQGFLDTLGIPYVGCNYFSCALCMNKAWTKQVASAHQIPIVRYVEMDRSTYRINPEKFIEKIEEELTFPVWVKSVHLGSSFGVSQAGCRMSLAKALESSFALDDYVIVEEEVRGREIEFAVLGNQIIRIAEPCEILTGGSFYDYEKKYGNMASSVQIPANITDIQKQIGTELAEKAYRACRCSGLARVDFFLDEQGVFWLNEINPFPGFTANSGYPKMWEQSGLSQRALMNELVILALSKVYR